MNKCLNKGKQSLTVESMGKLLETTREILRKSKVSRYRIAKDTGISQSTLSLFVNRKKNIGLDRAEILLNYLGYEVEVIQKESEAE